MRRHANFVHVALLTSDVACLGLVLSLVTHFEIPSVSEILATQRGSVVPFMFLGLLSLWMCGVHQHVRFGGWRTIKDLLAAMTVFVVLLTAFTPMVAQTAAVVPDVMLFWILAATALGLSRTLGLPCLRLAAPWGLRRRTVIVVGTGRVAQDAARRLSDKAEYGCFVRGYLSEQEAEVGQVFNGRPVIGTWRQLPALAETDVDLVLICLPAEAESRAGQLFRDLRNSLVDVQMIPSVAPASSEAVRMDAYMFEGLPVITIQGSPVYGWHGAGKRALDLAGSLAGLCLAFPLLLMIALLVKISSPGPVLYRQVRMSLAGQPFVMLKFRTMHDDVERHTGPAWAVRNDPRVTRIGRLLRKSCLDELPQLWNVLKGDMSLVGPRPERPTYIETFRQTYPAYMLRHKVKAGMTGWAQINGWRGDTCIQKRIAHDLYYIQHWSLWFDLKILCQTIWKGLLHENAY